jgi:hypothetical protein
MKNFESIAAFIVPTGIGASIGGFAGDASSYAREISKICPLIVNPNVVNAAIFSGINDKMLYTEGYAIDEFFKGKITLRPSKNNSIGIIFDKAIPENILNVHINTINAVKTVYDIKNIDFEITSEPVGVDFSLDKSGISSGTLQNPQTLIDTAKKLIERETDALGIVCLFDNSNDIEYANGIGVDPVGGIEAIISHILTKEFLLPCAHAPAFTNIDISEKIVDSRASAEYITPTFLPCILLGLNNAPKLISIDQTDSGDITLKNLKALIVPANALGGIPVLCAAEKNIPIIAVEENKTVLNITAEKLKISGRIIMAKDYVHAGQLLLELL